MCEFDKNNLCYALACYTSEKCEARDENGIPKYADYKDCIVDEEEEDKK